MFISLTTNKQMSWKINVSCLPGLILWVTFLSIREVQSTSADMTSLFLKIHFYYTNNCNNPTMQCRSGHCCPRCANVVCQSVSPSVCFMSGSKESLKEQLNISHKESLLIYPVKTEKTQFSIRQEENISLAVHLLD